MPYKIANWEKYQGWKTEQKKRPDNAPPYPWFKVHRKTLESHDFFSIPEEIRWQWFALLCLSDDNGTIAEDDDSIAWRFRITKFDPAPFLGKLLVSDIVPIEFRCASDEKPTRREEKREEDITPLAPETAPGPSLEQSSKKLTSKRSKPTYPPEFEALWKLFPHKENKLSALPVWRELSPGPELLEQMRGALEAQIAAGKWNKPPGEPMLQFVNWLKKRRWEDSVAVRAVVSMQLPSPEYCTKCRFGAENLGAYKSADGLWVACDCADAEPPERIARANAEILRQKQST